MSPTSPTPVPFVRVVTINFDGGDMTLRCLDSLRALDWPADRLEVVMVDNASVDGLARRVRAAHPEVRIIDSLVNEGFARGNNLALADLAGVDVVALVNNDSVVEPSWLRELVGPLLAEPDVGATCPRLLFMERAVGVEVRTSASTGPAGDPRLLGVRVSGAELDGVEEWARVDFDEGFHGPEAGDVGEPGARWSRHRGEVRVWLAAGEAPPARLRLRLSAPEARTVSLSGGGTTTVIEVGPRPGWFDVPLDAEPVDVVNNVGSNLYVDGSAGDRGFLQRDTGQFDAPAEVFGWCGGSVALRADYLRTVGLFDPRYFLYYEDTDLSWRGRLQGWRYRYVPTAVARHHHAASSGAGSDFFRFWVDRNRLLTLLKLAPVPMLRAALGEYLGVTARVAVGEVVGPLRRGRRPVAPVTARHLRVLRDVARHAPAMVRERRLLRAQALVAPRQVVRSWVRSRP